MYMADLILPDRYCAGRYLRRWSLVDGHPRCVLDALDTTTATAEDIAYAEAGNVAVHGAVATVEAYEAALALTTGREAPPALASIQMPDGAPYAPPNPAMDAWQAAQAVVATVTPDTLALAEVRQPKSLLPSFPSFQTMGQS